MRVVSVSVCLFVFVTARFLLDSLFILFSIELYSGALLVVVVVPFACCVRLTDCVCILISICTLFRFPPLHLVTTAPPQILQHFAFFFATRTLRHTLL